MKRMIGILAISIISIGVKAQVVTRWKVKDLVDYYSQKNDTVYVVNFWSTFCKPCLEEMPYLQSICAKYAGQKVKLLLVSLDMPKFYPDKLVAFVKSRNITASVGWLDETDADVFCPAVDAKWSGAIPATIMVNGQTGYKKFHELMFTPKQFEKELKLAIQGTVTAEIKRTKDHSVDRPGEPQ